MTQYQVRYVRDQMSIARSGQALWSPVLTLSNMCCWKCTLTHSNTSAETVLKVEGNRIMRADMMLQVYHRAYVGSEEEDGTF